LLQLPGPNPFLRDADHAGKEEPYVTTGKNPEFQALIIPEPDTPSTSEPKILPGIQGRGFFA